MSILPEKGTVTPKQFGADDQRTATDAGPASPTQTATAPEVAPVMGPRTPVRAIAPVASLGESGGRLTGFQRLVQELRAEAAVNASRDVGARISAEVITRILEAPSLDDAFLAQSADLSNTGMPVDVPLVISAITVMPSADKYSASNKLGVYVLATGSRLDTGETVRFTTGAPNIVTRLWRTRQADGLPLECVIKAKATANGEILSLRYQKTGGVL